MHEDLLGYLLGALEPHEMDRIAERIRDDPEAREQLAEIELALRPLEGSHLDVEPPPPDLIARTMASLPPLPSADNPTIGETSDEVALTPMRSSIEPPRNSSATWLDWVGGAAAAAVMLGLMLPMLAEGRFESRKAACQDQLRQLGTAITQFVNRNPQHRLPAVAESGPEAFAGIYAMRLNDAGLIDDPSIRWCPSLAPPLDNHLDSASINEIASIAKLHQSPVDRLKEIQQYSGGHYAYTLGVIDQDQFAPPRFEARSSFAVMSDAPMSGIIDRAELSKWVGHSGVGINVLYEDGRVKFVPLPSLDSMPDHPLLNHRGQVEAGVNVDDASLGPSWRAPFVSVRQR